MGKSNKQKSKLVKQTHPKRQQQGGASKQAGHMTQSSSAFKVSSHKAMKAKHKAKPVTTNLKWLNSKSSKQQVSSNNASFTSLQQALSTESRDKSKSSTKSSQANNKGALKVEDRKPVDVEGAMEQMASL